MSIIAYFIVTVFCIGLLLWTRFMIVDRCEKKVLPLGYMILFMLASLFPLINICLAIAMTFFYIGLRIDGSFRLKNNKFNNIFFKR